MKLYLYKPVMGSIPSETPKETKRGITTQPNKEITGRLKMRGKQIEHKKFWALKKNTFATFQTPFKKAFWDTPSLSYFCNTVLNPQDPHRTSVHT